MKVLVEADGGSRGNPGPAGYGAVVWSQDRATMLAEGKEAIGQATNNVAEYRGLIAGLEMAAELGASEVAVHMDSKLVVEQMSDRWRVKHPDLAPLHQQAKALATRFDRITYEWIPRAKNSYADRLANEAMDAAAEIENPTKAPTPNVAPQTSPAGWTGARGEPTRFLLLRHGQTELSTQRRYSGRGNPALTDVGRRQAELAAQYMANKGGVDAVVTSPLQRAYETAAAAAKALGLDVTVDEDLIETDFGAWEGLTFTEASQRDPEIHRRWLRDTSVLPPGGESFDSVAQRVQRAQNRLVTDYGGQTVLVVSHVTPIKTFLRIALDAGPNILYRLHLDLASLSMAEFYPDGVASVRLVNQTDYLSSDL
ncbi:bifunctional RNase H/acid phosphatase [Mycolicibacterium holsaticum]|uniref:bifunctional RNase H/acid phosphatase n=1 Tax=Mycolicibacterium holsaticum TaxID=152142 RepID=UPI001C7DD579|nr:bifunctional RNase H/acid phosphatase [Mycolicibacterium holsaticum]MDA4108044.1 RNase H [Mycolicibacterium holsaticum DSM 44478 = JCM 12374]QZA14533.1 bifunctional RNase H/acid phosphatase [Mycolicibacterium holsaticum DSM 44478 = JCM 12374]UNC08021.1 bifunctional RNase H/acid phosphatase [Mycolicibacterium holsaticum DSM 44478 = JCM 12374]